MNENLIFRNTYIEEVYWAPLMTTVVIPCSWNEVKEEQRQLLSRILQAVNLSLESVRIMYQQSLDLSSWSEKPKRLIAFVTPPKGLSLYETVQVGKTSMIFSDPLDILNTDDTAKRKLWSALKTLFPA